MCNKYTLIRKLLPRMLNWKLILSSFVWKIFPLFPDYLQLKLWTFSPLKFTYPYWQLKVSLVMKCFGSYMGRHTWLVIMSKFGSLLEASKAHLPVILFRLGKFPESRGRRHLTCSRARPLQGPGSSTTVLLPLRS